jgi:predicted GNAT family acetyltransferase
MQIEPEQDGYAISTDPARLDVDLIHGFLTQSYWSRGIGRAQVERGIANSLCFGLYSQDQQVGFARVITDRASFAYLADVFVVPERRRLGLASWLVATILEHPELDSVRRFVLVTRDAHAIYRRCGFADLKEPGRYMEIHRAGAVQAP